MSNPGHATIANGTVYYLYAAPLSPTDLKHELQVLEGFLAAWIADTPDNPAQAPNSSRRVSEKPSDTRASRNATRLVITAAHHKSTHASSASQERHLTVYLCTEAGWSLPTREYGAVAHVFANGEDPALGYKDYWMYSKKRQKFNSPVIQQALAAAEARCFGVLGEGDLADSD